MSGVGDGSVAAGSSGSQHPPGGFSDSEPERPPTGLTVSPERGFALAALHEAVADALRSGEPVPCVTDPEGGWTSDDPQARARAAWRCLDCAAFLACDLYGSRFPEAGAVWAGVGYSGDRAIQHLSRPEPDPGSSEASKPHVWMDSVAKQPPTRGFNQPKEAAMTSTTTNATGKCLCGCGEATTRDYRPGHDARHVSNLVRAVAEGTTEKRAALRVLPTEPLREKFTRSLGKATDKASAKAKAAAA